MARPDPKPFTTTPARRRLAALALGLLALAMAAVLPPAGGRVSADEKPLYLDASKPVEARIDDLLGRLTLEEKVSLVHANGKFRAGGIERLGVPPLWTADGPHGVREEVQVDSWSPAGWTTDYATAMPTGIALAATWSPELAELYGRTVGEEARARGKHVILGPGLNIQRTPLCGRNYDYFGEDPWLTSRLTVGYVKGMQAEQTVACIKHYALNNQEKDRGTIDVQVDERALREIYLPGFEAGVREGGALAVMAAYNKVRGQHAGHHEYLLNQVLKGEWGFRGSVISDWGSTHDTREAALYGLDLEMGTFGPYDKYFLAGPYLAGLKDGTYPVSTLDDKVRRNLRVLIAFGGLDGRRPAATNTKEHFEAARLVARESIVLLKNDASLLPLDLAKVRTIAVIGDNAVGRFAAGGNSAGVKTFREVTSLEGILARVAGKADVVFSQGYRQPLRRWGRQQDTAGVRTSELTAASPEEAKALADRAVETARRADVVVFVAGLTHQSYADDEGTDRRDLLLPAHQDDLIARVVEANPRTAVVLLAGSPVEMPWLAKTPAVLQSWYGGSEAGTALASILFGDASPSGRLPFTYPKALADSPAHAAGLARQFPGEGGKVFYDEGLLVGYRWNDAKNVEPLFPFGYGLTYTKFTYAKLATSIAAGPEGPTATLSLEVTNSGDREGAEVVQAYVKPVAPPVERPVKELKAFAKVALLPGETRVVKLTLGPRAFAYYDVAAKGWRVARGRYEVLVGSSSRDIRLNGAVDVAQAALLPTGPTKLSDQVKTANGIVESTSPPRDGVRSFKGLPFAAPPVGALRWREPQPPADWAGVRNADQFGPRCVQRTGPGADYWFRSSGMSEDCLYLNVWTPAKTGKEKLPVLVYVFGGGFQNGDGSEPRYDGESMARKGLVTLSVNYRTNVFGFFSHPELTKESPNHASGNYGLLDQVAALRWVQANIAAFGGDPKRVTIAGESAGSLSVSALMASPLSRGLVAGAIGESGALISTLPPRSLAETEQDGAKFGEAAGAPTLAALRALPAEKLLDALAAASSPPGGPGAAAAPRLRFSANLDGFFLPKTLAAIYEAGEQAKVPLLAGSNSQEMPAAVVLGQAEPTPETFAAAVRKLYPSGADQVLKVYAPKTPDEVLAAATDLASARFIAHGTWKWTELHLKTGGRPVYRYFYTRVRPRYLGFPGQLPPPEPPAGAPPPKTLGAAHSAEIQYAMGNLDLDPRYAWGPDDYRVSAAMRDYFANFAKTGNPNGPGLPKWPTYDAKTGYRRMRLDVTPVAEPETDRARYATLDAVAAKP